MKNTVDLCRTCTEPVCTHCDEDASQCVDGGWHCGGCSVSDCYHCSREASQEQLASIGRDL